MHCIARHGYFNTKIKVENRAFLALDMPSESLVREWRTLTVYSQMPKYRASFRARCRTCALAFPSFSAIKRGSSVSCIFCVRKIRRLRGRLRTDDDDDGGGGDDGDSTTWKKQTILRAHRGRVKTVDQQTGKKKVPGKPRGNSIFPRTFPRRFF